MTPFLVIGLIVIIIGLLIKATEWRDRPKPPTHQLVKPANTFKAEEVITLTRKRTITTTRNQ